MTSEAFRAFSVWINQVVDMTFENVVTMTFVNLHFDCCSDDACLAFSVVTIMESTFIDFLKFWRWPPFSFSKKYVFLAL